MASGRYAALLEPSKPPIPPSVSPSAPQPEEAGVARDEKKPANPLNRKLASPQAHKPTKPPDAVPAYPQTRNSTNGPLAVSAPGASPLLQGERAEKYTTRLRPSMVKKIKVYAAERDIKDYEVVENAILEYFARHTQ